MAAKISNVAIFLCTHNGENFIEKQLKSIANQSFKDFHIYASDDNSSDNTIGILETQAKSTPLSLRNGPNKGLVKNFLTLVMDARIKANYFAFSDQDDIWLDNHLSTAIQEMQRIPPEIPALFASRTMLIDETDHVIGISKKNRLPLEFKNSLIENVASGNTMVFNESARKLLAELATHSTPVWHDWALYQAITACGGKIIFSNTPTVLYRQHKNNMIGASFNWRTRINRIRLILKGRYQDWNNRNIKSLEAIATYMTPENKELLSNFKKMRTLRTPWDRICEMHRIGLYRQKKSDQYALYFATFLNLV